MDPSLQLSPKECYMFSAATKYPSSSRTSSISSSSSSLSSYCQDEYMSTLSPDTTLRSFSGVPFSWEYLPGIPKKQTPKKEEFPVKNFLPLPPLTTLPNPKKYNNFVERMKNSKPKDPFFAALVECSKNDDDREFWINGNKKISRNKSERFGFFSLHTASCKRTSEVAESITYLPRSSRSSYGVLNHSSKLS